MTRPYSNRRMFALSVLLALLTLSAYSLAAQDTPPEEPDTVIVVTSEPFEITFGSGPFNLLTTTGGLSDLSSYRATLTLSFEGTNAGQIEQWSHIHTMLVTQSPAARQLTIETSEDTAGQVYMAEISNTFYERQGGDICIASTIEPGAFAESWEPAGLLDSVIGADEAGTEIVNDLEANHYTFDESAQGMSEIVDSTGELWVASDGGYLVRYTLSTTGSADYFGEGIEGTMTWDYQLTDVNQPLIIEIPEDCPPPLLNVAVMPDAADVFQMPGLTSYTTSALLEDVLAFYQEQAAALGGQATSQPVVMDTFAMFGFMQGDQPILVIMSLESGGTSVRIQLLDDPSALAFAEQVPDARGTEVVTESGTSSGECPEGATTVPMLPDAAEVDNMFGILSYFTSTSVEDAAAFYEEQFTALGGQVSSPMPASDMMAVMDVAQGNQVISVIIADEGGSTSVSIASMSGEALLPASDCTAAEPATAAQPASTLVQCEAGTIAILSDAFNVEDWDGSVGHVTTTSVADATAFYEEQLAALGGEVTSSIFDGIGLLTVRQGDHVISVAISPLDEANNGVIITSVSMNLAVPPGDCSVLAPVDAQSGNTAETTGTACTVSTGTNANQRSGPGTNFDLAGTLAAGISAAVDGQATGTDGFVWWRLGEGVWVRSDVVNATGDCESVPVVQP